MENIWHVAELLIVLTKLTVIKHWILRCSTGYIFTSANLHKYRMASSNCQQNIHPSMHPSIHSPTQSIVWLAMSLQPWPTDKIMYFIL